MDFWTIAIIALLVILLLGQLVAEIGDVFFAVSDPRPVGGKEVELTIMWWGFATRKSKTAIADDCNNLGINDMRFFVSFRQKMICLFTLGAVRKVSIAYRCYGGDHDVGDA